MTTLSDQAATFMRTPKGMLVLDDYARTPMSAPEWPGLTFEQYTQMVLGSTTLGEVLSAVVVGPDAINRIDRMPSEVRVGVRMPLGKDMPDGDLGRQLATFAAKGVRLAEWRANLPVEHVPPKATHTDADALALGAAASLAEDVTPLLTVAMPDLESHTQQVTHAATANALTSLFAALEKEGVDPSAVLVRVNMILPGSAHAIQRGPDEVARSTLSVLDETVDPAVGGVMLLSGGQELDVACQNLRAIAALSAGSSRWPITFGFTRALVAASLDVADPHDEQLVHDALLRACRRASQSASGADSLASL